jgi:hypothetical protein
MGHTACTGRDDKCLQRFNRKIGIKRELLCRRGDNIIKENGMNLWTGFIWLRIWPSGGLL